MTINTMKFIAELYEASKANTLPQFIENRLGRDSARYYATEEGKYAGLILPLDLFTLTANEEFGTALESWNGAEAFYLPDEIRRALYNLGKESYNPEDIPAEDIVLY